MSVGRFILFSAVADRRYNGLPTSDCVWVQKFRAKDAKLAKKIS
jgi:hypothetical protein